jgi:hypothetical protein
MINGLLVRNLARRLGGLSKDHFKEIEFLNMSEAGMNHFLAQGDTLDRNQGKALKPILRNFIDLEK